jgi:DNA-directed RNA polymerase subunit beta'
VRYSKSDGGRIVQAVHYRKLIERGIVKTVKSAKKLVDRKDQVIWEILENILKGHPVMLNRAPTLHRLSIQAFQPRTD